MQVRKCGKWSCDLPSTVANFLISHTISALRWCWDLGYVVRNHTVVFRNCIYLETQQRSNDSMMPHSLTLALCAVQSFCSKWFANCTSIKKLPQKCISDSKDEETGDKSEVRNILLKREGGVCSLKMSMPLKTKIEGKDKNLVSFRGY